MNNSTNNTAPVAGNRQRRVMHCAVFCALVLLLPRLAGAADWAIDPVRIELSPKQPTAALTIKNESDQSTSIQIQAVAWSQLDGKDIYTPTRELLVSPPIATIGPKGEQVIRLALRRQADSSNELVYRINLQELPLLPPPGFTGVNVALRIGLPVFVQSQKGAAAPNMAWSITRISDSLFKVAMQNNGNAHVQVSDFSLHVPSVLQALTGEPGSSYVLAGQQHEWLVKADGKEKVAVDRLRLKAYTDAGDVDTELVLGKP